MSRTSGSAHVELELGVSAADRQDWGPARTHFLTAVASAPDDLLAHFNLAVSCKTLGELAAAELHAHRAGELAAGDRRWQMQCRALADEIRLQRALLPVWFEPAAFREDALELQPVQTHHAAILLELLRDRTVTEQTHLRGLDSLENVHRWIGQRARGAPSAGGIQLHALVIVHRERGIVGAVNLEQLDRRSTFSFWVGAGFQGRGFGSAALRVLHAAAPRQLGVEQLFTAVRADNPRSRHVLERCGWTRLPLRARGPERVDFYHRDLRDAARRPAEREAIDRSLAGLLSSVRSVFALDHE